MTTQRGVTVLIHRDGDLQSRSFRISLWAARTVLLVLATLAVIAIVVGVLYAPIVRTAATVPGLQRRIKHLEAENAQVQELARSLATAEERYGQIRGMLGGDIVPPPRSGEASDLPVALPLAAHPPNAGARFEAGPSVPTHWPLDERGVVTRGQVSPASRTKRIPASMSRCPPAHRSAPPAEGSSRRRATIPNTGCSCCSITRTAISRCMVMRHGCSSPSGIA